MVQLIDNYAATYSLLIIGLFECVTISYIYGVDRFMTDIESMLGKKPHYWWKAMWCYVTPALLVFIMIFTWVDYVPSKYADYHFPAWADVLGWLISLSSVMAIPIVMVVKICLNRKQHASVWATIKFLAKPSEDWGLNQAKDAKFDAALRIPLNDISEAPSDIQCEMQEITVPLKSDQKV